MPSSDSLNCPRYCPWSCHRLRRGLHGQAVGRSAITCRSRRRPQAVRVKCRLGTAQRCRSRDVSVSLCP